MRSTDQGSTWQRKTKSQTGHITRCFERFDAGDWIILTIYLALIVGVALQSTITNGVIAGLFALSPVVAFATKPVIGE